MKWVLFALFVAVLFLGVWKILDSSKEYRTEKIDQEDADQILSSRNKSSNEKTPWVSIFFSLALAVVGFWVFDHYFLTVLNFFQDLLSRGQ